MALRISAAILLAVGAGVPAAATPVVDSGPIMQAEAMGSATMDAAREGSGPATARQSRASTPASRAKAQASCAKARGWAADGMRSAPLTRALGLCQQLGY